MQPSMTPTMEPEVIRRRVLLLLGKMPDMLAQMEQDKSHLAAVPGKQRFLLEMAMRALPGLLPMAAGIIHGMAVERLASYIPFIKNILETMGNPQVSDEQFNDLLNGKTVDSSTQYADTTSQDAAQVR